MILSILKVIGVILLVILAVLIFILLLVLFVPIRYRFFGSYEDTADGEAKIKWAPVLLKAFVAYHNNQLEYTVWLFGGVVLTNTTAKLSFIGRRFFGSEEEEVIGQTETQASKSLDMDVSFMDTEHRNGDVFGDEEDWHEEEAVLKKHALKNDRKAEQKKRKSFFERIKETKKAFHKRCQRFSDRLKSINDKKDALLRVYHSRRFEQAKIDLKQYIGVLFRILKPDQLEGYVRFGLKDPSNTGYVLGGLSMMLPLYQGFLTIEPDFTQQIIKGNLKGNGKIRLISVVKLGIKVILNKNLIKVTKKVQTILEA